MKESATSRNSMESKVIDAAKSQQQSAIAKTGASSAGAQLNIQKEFP